RLLLVTPFTALARWWRNEPVDGLYNGVIALTRFGHRLFIALQNGEVRWYATTLTLGLIFLLSIALGVAP
ncbi:MAG: NADH-quinone oxidoreductase subunit L, partial [Pseudomonadota bacterium]